MYNVVFLMFRTNSQNVNVNDLIIMRVCLYALMF